MPDPTLSTISATEASALFGVSPYVTPWMLYRRFAHGEEAYVAPHSRLDWGKKLEPLILDQASQDLKVEVRPNIGPDGNQVYVRRGLFGCTRDAEVWCPDRGFGVLETKCVFDYRIWMQDWNGGNNPPRHHEIQVQTQMYVGDGEKPYQWGIEAVWVAGELVYFERKPIPKFWSAMEKHGTEFFADVKAGNEPNPFGSPREYPLLKEVFGADENIILDLREKPEGFELAELVRLHDYHRNHRLSHKKGEDALALKIGIAAKDAGEVLLPHRINVKVAKNKGGFGIKSYIPKDVPEGDLTEFEGADLGG